VDYLKANNQNNIFLVVANTTGKLQGCSSYIRRVPVITALLSPHVPERERRRREREKSYRIFTRIQSSLFVSVFDL
jgi:hypothetical protein